MRGVSGLTDDVREIDEMLGRRQHAAVGAYPLGERRKHLLRGAPALVRERARWVGSGLVCGGIEGAPVPHPDGSVVGFVRSGSNRLPEDTDLHACEYLKTLHAV